MFSCFHSRLCAAEKKELYQQAYQGEDQSENSLPIESRLLVGSDAFIHHEAQQPTPSHVGGESGETSSILSPSPGSSSEHQSDHIGRYLRGGRMLLSIS